MFVLLLVLYIFLFIFNKLYSDYFIVKANISLWLAFWIFDFSLADFLFLMKFINSNIMFKYSFIVGGSIFYGFNASWSIYLSNFWINSKSFYLILKIVDCSCFVFPNYNVGDLLKDKRILRIYFEFCS